MEHLSGSHRFGTPAGMAVIEPTFLIKNTRTIAHGNPLHVAHRDIANTSHGAAQTLHNVPNWKLVGKLCKVNDVVVISQTDAVRRDDGDGG